MTDTPQGQDPILAGETDGPPCGSSRAIGQGNEGEGAPPDYHLLEPPILMPQQPRDSRPNSPHPNNPAARQNPTLVPSRIEHGQTQDSDSEVAFRLHSRPASVMSQQSRR